MELGSILASGWASGINLYGTVFLLGLANRLDWASTPPALGETWVLVLSGLLYAVEFVVDKIPWLDSPRPLVGTSSWWPRPRSTEKVKSVL